MKRQKILGIWREWRPLVTPMPACGLLGLCGRPGARRHHVGDTCCKRLSKL